jgi:hypothetical protein
MTVAISKEAQTALQWAFGAYADKDPGIPFDLAQVADMPDADEITPAMIDNLAEMLIRSVVMEGLGNRICLGWCTFRANGRFGLGVMALRRQELAA